MKIKRLGKELPASVKTIVALLLGIIAGVLLGDYVGYLSFLGDIYIRLLKLSMYPLIFVSIIHGITQVRDMNRLKTVGKHFINYWFFSGIFISSLGLIMALIFQPGSRGIGEVGNGGSFKYTPVSFKESLISWFPENPFQALSEGNVIQIVVLSIIIGIVLAAMPMNKEKEILLDIITASNILVSNIITWIIKFAPIGIFILIANMVASLGADVIANILNMMICLYATFAVLFLIIYPLFLLIFVKVNPIEFYKKSIPVIVMAFSTCSSNASIPLAMSTAKEKYGVPEDIVNLVTAPAVAINKHANCLETSIFCLFAMQLYGREIKLADVFMIILLGLLSAIGAAGVPNGGIMMVAFSLQFLNLPLDIVPWIIGAYTLIDLPGTVANITGNLVGLIYTGSSMKELDYHMFRNSQEL